MGGAAMFIAGRRIAMSVISKIGKLTIAGAIVAAMTSPSLADWVVTQVGDECNVIEESAAGDEIRVAGPFATQEEADKAKAEHPECAVEKN